MLDKMSGTMRRADPDPRRETSSCRYRNRGADCGAVCGYSRASAINSLKRLGGRRKEFHHGAFGMCVLVMPEIISGVDLRWTWRTRRKNAPKNLLRRPGQRFQYHEHGVGVTSAHN